MVWQPTTVIVSVAIILHHITVEKLQLIITTHHHNKILHTNPKSEEKKENFSPRHVKTTKNRTTNPCTQPKVAYKRTTVIRASIDVSRYKKNTQHQSRPNSCSLSTTSHSIVLYQHTLKQHLITTVQSNAGGKQHGKSRYSKEVSRMGHPMGRQRTKERKRYQSQTMRSQPPNV